MQAQQQQQQQQQSSSLQQQQPQQQPATPQQQQQDRLGVVGGVSVEGNSFRANDQVRAVVVVGCWERTKDVLSLSLAEKESSFVSKLH